MMQVQPQTQSRRLNNDLLPQAIERLEHAMAADVPGRGVYVVEGDLGTVALAEVEPM